MPSEIKLSKLPGVIIIINFLSFLAVLTHYAFTEVQKLFKKLVLYIPGKRRTLTLFSENGISFTKAHVTTINVIKC